MWITLTAAGVVHWSFALEYETSSLIMIKKLEVYGKSVGQIDRKKRAKIFWIVSTIYAIIELGFCLG